MERIHVLILSVLLLKPMLYIAHFLRGKVFISLQDPNPRELPEQAWGSQEPVWSTYSTRQVTPFRGCCKSGGPKQ